MAKYYTAGSINASGNWNVIAETSSSYNDSESTTTALTTSYQASSSFTPGAVTVTHIGVKLSVRTGTTGTISVNLRNTTAGADVSGTEVTINTADLPVAATADLNGGWHFFKLSSPVLLLAATNYAVQAKTSSSSQISLFATATTNWARAIVTNATGTPGAGDDMINGGEYTGTGTSNTHTLTWDITATTDYGSAPSAANSLLTPGLAICNKGVWSLGTSAATNYNMKMSSSIIGYSGGVWNEGTTGTPLPRGSTFTLQIDVATNVDWGFEGRNLFTSNRQALSRTSGKNIDRCYLNTDEAANSTSLGVDTGTGWLDNDVIAIASTTRTGTQSESGTLNGNAGASTLTVDGFAGTAGGILNAHGGTAPVQAEVILLTRSSVWKGASASLQTYVRFGATASVDWDWAECMWMGSNTTNKRGLDLAVTTGTQSFTNCSLHDFSVSGSRGFNVAGTSGTGLSITNCVTYNIANDHFINVANSGSAAISGLWCILNTTASTNMVTLGDAGSSYSDILAVGATGVGVSATENALLNSWANIRSHSCTSYNIEISNGTGYINGMTSYRGNGNGGLAVNGGTNGQIDIEIDNLLEFGSNTQNVRLTVGTLQLNSPILAGDSTFATASGISNQGNSSNGRLFIQSGQLGVATAFYATHTTADITVGAQGIFRVDLNNTILGSATEVNTPSSLCPGTFIASHKHDQVAGAHKTWVKTGILESDTTVTHSPNTVSLKMTPNSATLKLESMGIHGPYKVPVANGQTVGISIFVAQSATYNGNRARLIQKRNDAIGLTSEVVLDTATSASDYSGGYQWEELTGTTGTVNADGTVEFVIDCDGTVGFIEVAGDVTIT